MDNQQLFHYLKGLTLDLFHRKRSERDTARELTIRICTFDMAEMPGSTENFEFIQHVYWSLLHLVDEKGAETGPEEIQYLAECFEGKRTYSKEDWSIYLKGKLEKS